MLRDMTQFTMTQTDTEDVNAHLSNAGRIFNKISGSTLRTLEANQDLAQLIETFNNTYVRKGEVIGNTKTHVAKLITHIKQKFQKEIDKRKSVRGKQRLEETLKQKTAQFEDQKDDIVNLPPIVDVVVTFNTFVFVVAAASILALAVITPVDVSVPDVFAFVNVARVQM